MFDKNLCNLCGDCLVECQWIEVDREEAMDWMEAMINGDPAPPVEKCITCYACNEICPMKANPFDLIASLQEKYEKPFSPDKIEELENQYVFSGDLRPLEQSADRILATCVFGKSEARLLEGPIYDLPRVGGKPYFCWVLFSHTGAESIQKKHAAEFVDRLARTGAKEVVCFHDDCYSMLTCLAPQYGIEAPFRAIHLAEYLVEYLTARKKDITPLNLEMAYQRPCASRFTPEKEIFVDRLFDLTGVTRVKRKYDREKALCCAGTKMLLGLGDPKPDQEKNLKDAKAAGAKALVYLCPVCGHSFSATAAEQELPLIFLGDLARMALGEIKPEI